MEAAAVEWPRRISVWSVLDRAVRHRSVRALLPCKEPPTDSRRPMMATVACSGIGAALASRGRSRRPTRSASKAPCKAATAPASDSTAPQLLRQWRQARRSRVLNDLDWTRYHLWVYFVDSVEPSFARARLCRFFFEKVCESHGHSSSLLYCAAGGLEDAAGQEELELISSVPGLDWNDMEHLVVPPYTFTPQDFSMYDVVVAVDDDTADAVRQRMRAHGGNGDPDQLCVLSDFFDAYDILLEEEQREAEVERKTQISPGILTLEGLEHLRPGQPLRGTPLTVPIGSPLEGLPESWSEELWRAARGTADGLPQTGCASSRLEEAGSILRSIIGLERVLRASIPSGMRWWNDED
eukprot:TRINITY_DN105997_c0_g1_i1.p1 TRINITY_DN105997_c0_g1~~TRINITY_DN105997_c0_g1_i1.p1  ORF type:complete len:353 (-),score=60.36 TRINITY_DN105997_c0_g1_i1:97-1155(-)